MTKYRSSTSEYASLYGVNRSTIFRWKTEGAPLDDPEAMLVFRANEHSRNGVSKSNHRRTSFPKTSCASSCAPSQPGPVKETKTDPLRVEVEKHIGMSAGIKRLQAVEVLLAFDYEDTRRSRDMGRAKACREEWLAVFEQLRRIEATSPEVEKLKKESVAISEVKIEVHRAYSAVRSALDALPDRLTHKAVGLDAPAMRTAVQREIAVICRHLVEWKDLKRERS